MTKNEIEKAFVIIKEIKKFEDFSFTKREMISYKKVSLHCGTDYDLLVGDKIRIVKGRKHPIGTEGVVLKIRENQYGRTFRCALTGKEHLSNPCLLVELDNGERIWTVGDNCWNLSNIEKSVNQEIYFEDFELEEKGFISDKPMWMFNEKENKPVQYTTWIADYGLSVYENCFREFDDRFAMVVYDWRSDTYSFLVFSKEIKPNNEIINKSTGVSIKFTDMDISGMNDAVDNFNGYCKNFNK